MGIQLILIALNYFILSSGNIQQDPILLFDGVSLKGWKDVEYSGQGQVKIVDSCIVLSKGVALTGIKWENEFPKSNYELSLEAKRIEGSDFFCGLTFPVQESFNSLIIGGWGGTITGLSSIDDEDAANNTTTDFKTFEMGRWYKIRLRVTDEKIVAWIDNDLIVDFTIGDHKLSLRWEVESFKPLGIATYQTAGALRNIKLEKNIE